jgi:hypothetical protein
LRFVLRHVGRGTQHATLAGGLMDQFMSPMKLPLSP